MKKQTTSLNIINKYKINYNEALFLREQELFFYHTFQNILIKKLVLNKTWFIEKCFLIICN